MQIISNLSKSLTAITTISLLLILAALAAQSPKEDPQSKLLPEKFPIYVKKGQLPVNKEVPGYNKKILPTVNKFKDTPGCYIACYSKDSKGSVYSVGGGIYVKGQIRVSGRYIRRVCHPKGFVHKDISDKEKFKNLCNEQIDACSNCWAGGDTGGWFGIQ